MGRKRTPGLVERNGIWHIDKRISGRRVQRSTGTRRLEEAEAILAKVIDDARHARVYGTRPDRTFEEAATKYVLEHTHKASLRDDVHRLRNLMPFIGHDTLRQVHMGSLAPWIATRRRDGVAEGTINHGLQIVRRILNLAATEWIDEHGLTWLAVAPNIKLLPNRGKRQPYPLSWTEQEKLLAELPEHLRAMALFKVNTGLRDADVCGLLWADEVPVPELGTSVFIIPAERVKNTDSKRQDDRLVVLNSVAAGIVDSQRARHLTHVFSYEGAPVTRMGNSAWYAARKRAGLEHVRVHDLKHTFGRRLRAAGVSYEDRQDLLGHRSSRMTTHYSAGEWRNLIDMADRLALRSGNDSVPIIVLKRRREGVPQTPGNAITTEARERPNPLKTLVAEEGLEPPTRGL